MLTSCRSLLASWRIPLLAAVLALALLSCRGGGANPPSDVQVPVIKPTTPPSACQNDRYPADAPQFEGNELLNYQTTASGLKVYDFTPGSGQAANPSAIVEVHYTGWLLDGCIFDSSHLRGDPVLLPLPGVIEGWQEGIGSMNVGGRRRLEIPPDLGYGSRGALPSIPPDATIVFDVELFGVYTEMDITATQEAMIAEATAEAEAEETPASQ